MIRETTAFEKLTELFIDWAVVNQWLADFKKLVNKLRFIEVLVNGVELWIYFG